MNAHCPQIAPLLAAASRQSAATPTAAAAQAIDAARAGAGWLAPPAGSFDPPTADRRAARDVAPAVKTGQEDQPRTPAMKTLFTAPL